MDDLRRQFATLSEFRDVVCLVVLKQDKEKYLRKMVADRRLALLMDTQEVALDRVYGLDSTRPWRVFGRSGCIASDSLGMRLEDAADPTPLLELLRRIDS